MKLIIQSIYQKIPPFLWVVLSLQALQLLFLNTANMRHQTLLSTDSINFVLSFASIYCLLLVVNTLFHRHQTLCRWLNITYITLQTAFFTHMYTNALHIDFWTIKTDLLNATSTIGNYLNTLNLGPIVLAIMGCIFLYRKSKKKPVFSGFKFEGNTRAKIAIAITIFTLVNALQLTNSDEIANLLFSLKKPPSTTQIQLETVAHAGGKINGQIYTNSLAALNHNYEMGFRLFEIDFNWTKEGNLICLHKWNDRHFKNAYGYTRKEAFSDSEFEAFRKSSPIASIGIDELIAWVKTHPDARIITDIKSNNLKGLQIIATLAQTHTAKFIPQIYQPNEYSPAKEMGYETIIWTLYRYSGNNKDVLKHAKKMDLFAITMPSERAEQGVAKTLAKHNIYSYVHTINSPYSASKYINRYNAAGIYTDGLFLQ
ncbi:MAG: hypothetical protein O3A01_08550 [bacterium]|nr:hypothetical protein [bacterium]